MKSLLKRAILTLLLTANTQCCTLNSQNQVAYKRDGDILIGGTFPVTYATVHAPPTTFTKAPQAASCDRIAVNCYILMLAMVYTIEEINHDQNLLPNVTLGHEIYDTCLSMERLLQGTVSMLTGYGKPILNYCCQSQPPLAAVIGDSSSTRSIPMARLLGLYRQPQVSYAAASPQLSQKLQFPSFLRTMANGNTQAMGISQLVLHFQWTWVGILSTDNDYGESGSSFVIGELQRSGVCIAFHAIIPIILSQKQVIDIVEVVTKSSANVIILYATEPYRNPVINELSRHNVRGKVWIDIETWTLLAMFTTKELVDMMDGTLGIAMHEGEMPGFKDFLLNLQLYASARDIFIKLFWEEAFGCKWPSRESNLTVEHSGERLSGICSGDEDLQQLKNQHYNNPDLKSSYNVYKAVYVVAHALQDLSSCMPGHGPFLNHTCADLRSFKPWQLLHYMKHVNFKTRIGEEVSFDSNGDPPAFYDITNLQTHQNGSTHIVIVGSFTTGESTKKQLYINSSAIIWNGQRTEVPRSACSESCAPGYRKAARRGEPSCCFDCIPCAEGEISNETDSTTCWRCASTQWPNDKRTACVPKAVEFLSYQEPLGATLTGVAIFTSFLTALILIAFFKNRETPIVKANNRVLTYLLLTSLIFSFLGSLLFIGPPRSITCLLRQPAFGIMFAFCVSCVLSKTVMVVIAFNAAKPGSNMKRWLGHRVPMVTVSSCTFGQVLICAVWLLVCPPFPETNMKLKIGTILFQCNECSETAFWCMLGYMGLLACASFLVAFLARNLPDSFNEAKWITFSMLAFLSVWFSFIPGYLSTQGKYMVAVEVFGIISSSAGLLFCIFLPKCHIIFLKPELNSRQYLLKKSTT